MRKWLGWLTVLGLAWMTVLTVHAKEEEKGRDSIRLRVMSYNIHYGAGMDGEYNLDRIASVIRESKADVIGLQEVDVHWGSRSRFENAIRILADKLHMHAVHAPIYRLDPLESGQPMREFGVAILSRYPIMKATNHQITRLSIQEPNPTPKMAPGFLEATLAVHGMRLPVFVTHLDYRSDPSVRTMQVADMLEIMNRHRSKPHLLVGDFNAPPDALELSPLHARFQSVLSDHEKNWTYPADVPVKQIDYIWVSEGIQAIHGEVLASQASDHRPVIADLKVVKKKR